MAANLIQRFAASPDAASVLTDAEYAASPLRTGGHALGLAYRALENKALRQQSAMTTGLARHVADHQTVDVSDDLSDAQIAAMLRASMRPVTGAQVVAYRSPVGIAVPKNTVTFVPWTHTAVVDALGVWSASAPTRLTVPTGYTQARVRAGVVMTSAPGYEIQAVVWRNRAYSVGTARAIVATADGSQTTMFVLGGPWMPVAAGDFYELFLIHNMDPPVHGVYGGLSDADLLSCYLSIEARK